VTGRAAGRTTAASKTTSKLEPEKPETDPGKALGGVPLYIYSGVCFKNSFQKSDYALEFFWSILVSWIF
jgi:hypothetical protein